MLIMAIAATLVAPAYIEFGKASDLSSTDRYMKLLRDTRSMAITHTVEATLIVDPVTGRFRIDTVSSFGAGKAVEDSLQLGATERLETELPRLRYVFRPTGATFADTVLMRGMDSTRLIIVNPWSGVPSAIAR